MLHDKIASILILNLYQGSKNKLALYNNLRLLFIKLLFAAISSVQVGALALK